MIDKQVLAYLKLVHGTLNTIATNHNFPFLPSEITPPSPPLNLRGGRVGLRVGAAGGGVVLKMETRNIPQNSRKSH